VDLFTRDELQTLIAEREPPCVSIFLPTHPVGAEADPILWKKQLSQAERQLTGGGMRAREAKKFLNPARRLLEDPLFWRNQSHGLAFFLDSQVVRLYRLPAAVGELVAAGALFQITPLLPLLSDNGRFFVLALSANAVRLLQGTHYTIGEIDLRQVPRSLAQALLTHDTDEPLTFHTRPAGGLGSWSAIFHGHGVGIDDKKDDLLRYFQQINRGLRELLAEEKAPLVLAADAALMPLYLQASTYPHLLASGVEGNPDRLSPRELHTRAWPLVCPSFRQDRDRALARYRQLAGTGRTAQTLEQIAPAACAGGIETLFVARGRQCWGKFLAEEMRAQVHDLRAPRDEDLLNLVVVHALRHRCRVYAVEPEAMPDGVPAAAVYHFPLHGR
jgi:hypothetical protein